MMVVPKVCIYDYACVCLVTYSCVSLAEFPHVTHGVQTHISENRLDPRALNHTSDTLAKAAAYNNINITWARVNNL